MSKVLSTLIIFLFVLIAGFNPYVSSKGAAVAATQSAEADLNYQPLEEEIHESAIVVFVLEEFETPESYPDHLHLKPQYHPPSFLRPPTSQVV